MPADFKGGGATRMSGIEGLLPSIEGSSGAGVAFPVAASTSRTGAALSSADVSAIPEALKGEETYEGISEGVEEKRIS